MGSQYSTSSFDEAYSDKSSSNHNNNPSSTDTLIQTLQSVESLECQQLFETAPYSNPQNQLLFPARSQNLLYANCFDFDLFRTHIQELPRSTLASESYLVSAPPLTETDKSRIMSALALQYDNNFSMGSRSSFTWPVLDSGSGLISPEFGSYGSDSSFAGSRSGTTSPPRTSLSAEQRELKRQRDQARRDSKMHIRGRRAGSSSSSGVYSPPPSLAVMSSGAPGMPIYTSAGPVSLMAETHTTRYQAQFSPPLPDHHNTQSNMYHNSYPTPTYINDYGYPASATPSLPSYYGRQMSDPNLMYPVSPPTMGGSPQDTAGQVRVVQPRPKPQCWDHGCNGRQFSTFSNLLRHQREKSGQATKATCPNCHAEFTRTTARNGHLLHDKCKQKRIGS
ncbi:hypothetical protein GE21DRAFT_2228 [Neurospora crassa]|uniref:C2H2-type domain-containing protein n=1 Tax=Neurospora crassa (strain ATCC 24698 / 74-OR23-1A / CBS 708.71 / DSM 1257 / FGSC 987) TaxID=367110 RepID=Q7SE64_NEUCR|nr:hypothetical protein NCU00509 [Neurospora crassa OR74A]EAA35077.2 hypothetical protein NCU00509 [Neurospora crassa OR74A]KHE85085.1 hypothetical protein GE21DRAFT_2228 [Neurospora crassa]|eukprot:XP_964313.2 hypothetical protein NCU00509 [Neurospora crassa OR74A]